MAGGVMDDQKEVSVLSESNKLHRAPITEDQDNGEGYYETFIHRSKAAWISVPQFGDWDLRCGVPDYSMDFSKIRESRKQSKKDLWRSGVGNEEELIIPHPQDHDYHQQQQQKEQQHEQVQIRFQTRRKKILGYFSSCIKAFPFCKCGRVL